MCELVVTIQSQLESHTEPLDAHDGDGPDQTTDRDVDQWCPLAILWYHSPDHEDGEACDEEAVHHECWRKASSVSPLLQNL